MSFRIDYEKLLEKYKAIWSKIENLKNIELNTLLVNDDRYLKSKIRTYGDKFHAKCAFMLHGLNVLEEYIECESFVECESFLLILCLYTKKIWSISTFRQLCLQNYGQTNEKLS